MSVSPTTLKEVILENQLVLADQLGDYEKQAFERKLPLENFLIVKKVITEDGLAQALARHYKVEMVDLKNKKIDQKILHLVPEPIARRHRLVAFEKKGDKLLVGMLDPDDLQTREFIKKKTNFEVVPYLCTHSGLDFALAQYHASLKSEFEKILKGHEDIAASETGPTAEMDEELKKMAQEIPVVRVVDTLLEYAIYEHASDIHIEPQENEVMVRYRIDGILHDVMTLPKVILPALVARVKVLSSLKIDEHRLPQDGRFRVERDEHKISLRISTIPVFAGEKIVMRLLEEGAQAMTFEQLGFAGKALEDIKSNLKKPHGMTLVTGPTGSGKSTTLYTVLSLLNTKKVNISTIEDPIEYRMPGVNQMQVSPKIGLTFAIGLRALLRQDPNIIMIGEIRDHETAEEAVHAAMTGHLVLSTLHTNSAAGALPRLIDMGIEPFLIASTVNNIIAQRLARRICPDCKQKQKIDKKLAQSLEKDFDVKRLLEVMKREGAIAGKVGDLTQIDFCVGEGCEKCNNSGYKGRSGLFEVLPISAAIMKLILSKASSGEIEQQAIAEGMVLMWQDGFIKAHEGMTTIEEVIRVSKE
ncbi:MAG: ATPase, T2SS/T4P/T4SS family [bacterium]|nr:ATPase, T2SS/T4P/T4SS family [bacterium]